MIKINRIIILLSFLSYSFNNYGQLYTEYTTPNQLDSLVQNNFATPSVQISNINFTGAYFAPNGPSSNIFNIGYFNALNSTVGIDSGIILTGGYLDPPYGLGQPASVIANYNNVSPGDSLLDLIIAPSLTTSAAVLEFDFVPNGDTIKFNYVFASDEYPHQICHPDNDVFAFHISGTGISGMKNIALIPNTNFPVGNNTINDTSYTPYPPNTSLCQTIAYPHLYVDHTFDTNLVFNGSTTVLTAKSATVPCQTYHLRFSIAEGVTNYENSAVFLEANSFNSEPLKIESNVSYGGNDTVLYEGCGSAQILFRRTYNIQQSKTYNISVTGSAQNGIDYDSLPSSITMQAGSMYDTLFIYPASDFIVDDLENIIITIGDTLCNGQYYETDIELVIYEKPNFNVKIIPDTGAFCDTVLFSAQIQGALPSLMYNWNKGLSSDSTFQFFPSFQGDYINDNIHLQVIDGCGSIAHDTVNIIFSKYPKALYEYAPDYIDLKNSIVKFQDLSENGVVSWLWDLDDELISSLQNPIHNYLDTGNYNVKLSVFNQFGCGDSIVKLIRVNDLPNLTYPNTFSPNNDGVNDFFIPLRFVGVEAGTIEVFNRWGDLVYKNNDLTEGWSGKHKEKELPSGTYYWVCSYSNVYDEVFQLKGCITLFR